MSTYGNGPWGPPGGPGPGQPGPGPGPGPYPYPYPGGPGGPGGPGAGPYPPGGTVPPQGPYPPGPYGPQPPSPLPPRPPLSRGQRILKCVYNPFYAAQRAFRPSRPGTVEDPTVRKIQNWRTGLGIVAWLVLVMSYKPVDSAKGVGEVADDKFSDSWISTLVLVCAFPFVIALFAFAARGALRGLYLRRSLKSFGAVAALMGSMATFPLAMAPDAATTAFRDAVGTPGKVVIITLCAWSLGFALYGIWLCLTHVFRTADIHEVLPPVLATLLVWVMAALAVFSNEDADVPALARIAFLLGGPVSVTVLSCWELYRLGKYHDMSVRQALGR
ncbi:hypothetical protein OG234_01785 [Streptomyces sp. NBC_01420]|uniref:hypothetical protein n=1 Tax=Streptomyces sp. NBC_01420 TaxID=2903858 RepID=UPI0032446621